ncbi:MAG: hypothetical protein GXO89_09230 [Chlorobi bacterium]|nr:hypothetical protein [Chlorobiota bacterium]
MIIANKRLPEQAKDKLKGFGDVLFLETEGITYNAISGHPDIFFCTGNNKLIVAPNLPEKFKVELMNRSLDFVFGKKPVGVKYPETAFYNAVVTDNYLIHNLKYTDTAILESSENLKMINVKQAYTRCNLLSLPGDRFITSDRGIEKALINEGLEILYVSPRDVLLPGFEHGFFGGACGVFENKLLLIGSLEHFNDGEKIRQFLAKAKMEIIELYDGPLVDGGSILTCWVDEGQCDGDPTASKKN